MQNESLGFNAAFGVLLSFTCFSGFACGGWLLCSQHLATYFLKCFQIFRNHFSKYVSDRPVIDRDFHMFSNPVLCVGGLDLCGENVVKFHST